MICVELVIVLVNVYRKVLMTRERERIRVHNFYDLYIQINTFLLILNCSTATTSYRTVDTACTTTQALMSEGRHDACILTSLFTHSLSKLFFCSFTITSQL